LLKKSSTGPPDPPLQMTYLHTYTQLLLLLGLFIHDKFHELVISQCNLPHFQDIIDHTHTHTHTHMHESNTLTTTICGSLDSVRDYRVSQYQKGKTNLDLLQQETVSQSGISWPYANLHLAPDR